MLVGPAHLKVGCCWGGEVVHEVRMPDVPREEMLNPCYTVCPQGDFCPYSGSQNDNQGTAQISIEH